MGDRSQAQHGPECIRPRKLSGILNIDAQPLEGPAFPNSEGFLPSPEEETGTTPQGGEGREQLIGASPRGQA